MSNLKKWAPFIFLISMAVIIMIYLLVSQQQAVYIPTSDDPEQIYREACAYCHGIEGEGEGLLYPDLLSNELSPHEIHNIISEGALFMPAFLSIHGDTLESLTRYVYNKEFIKISRKK